MMDLSLDTSLVCPGAWNVEIANQQVLYNHFAIVIWEKTYLSLEFLGWTEGKSNQLFPY